MQSTGQGSTHFPQPEHSSGMITTSMPWLKMAPNCGGQWRMHVSQLMQMLMSMMSFAVLADGSATKDGGGDNRLGELIVIPAGPFQVCVRLPEAQDLRAVRLLHSKNSPPYELSDGRLTLTVDSILDHEIVAIDLAALQE